jgi:AcrR family transcriptional regulator
MNAPTSDRSTRPYNSALRAGLVNETRRRILDGLLRVMGRGVATVSIPAVAREAGVSVPTIYRHFGNKVELIEAAYPHLMRRAGVDEISGPRSIDDLREGLRALLGRLDRIASMDELARAALASPAAEEARRRSMPRRYELTRTLADTIDPPLAKIDRDRIARLLVVLTTSSSLRTWRDHLGSSVDEVADDIDWMVRSAARGARRRSAG